MDFVALKEKTACVLAAVFIVFTLYYTYVYYEDYEEAIEVHYGELVRERDQFRRSYEMHCMNNVDIVHSGIAEDCTRWRRGSFDIKDYALKDRARRHISRTFYHSLTAGSIIATGGFFAALWLAVGLLMLGRIWDVQRKHHDECNRLPAGSKSKRS